MAKRALLGAPESAEMKALFSGAEKFFKENPNDLFKLGEFTVIKIAGIPFAIKEAHPIGEGGFGKVYIGQDENGACIAIKLENYERLKNENRVQDKKKESEILKKLGRFQGEGIQKLKEPETITFNADKPTNEIHYTGLSLEKGKELLKALSPENMTLAPNEKLDAVHLLEIALKAAYEINLLHSLGIIHIDIKPENFMASIEKQSSIGPHIEVVSIDFGLSELLPEGKNEVITKRGRGTESYAAPEVYEGRYSAASDIFALGKMFEMMRLPKEIWENMVEKDPRKRISLLEIINKLVDELTEYELDERTLELIAICQRHLESQGLEITHHRKFLVSNMIKDFRRKFETEIKNSPTINKILNSKIYTGEEKAIAIKGFLLQNQAKLESELEPKSKEILNTIDQIVGRARFLGDDCREIYSSIEAVDKKGALLSNRIEKEIEIAREKLNKLNQKPKSKKILFFSKKIHETEKEALEKEILGETFRRFKEIQKIEGSLSVDTIKFTQITHEQLMEFNQEREDLAKSIECIKNLETVEDTTDKLKKLKSLEEEIKELDIKNPKSFKDLREKLELSLKKDSVKPIV